MDCRGRRRRGIVDTNGHLGTVVSSARFKEEIKPMEQASEALLALNPLPSATNTNLIPKAFSSSGWWLRKWEKINPDLVARDEKGKVYTVRYEAVNAMLLNEFLEGTSKSGSTAGRHFEGGCFSDQQEKEINALTAALKNKPRKFSK